MISRFLWLLSFTFIQLIDNRLVDARAHLSRVKLLPVGTALAAMGPVHAHARLLVPVLAVLTLRLLGLALLNAFAVTGEFFSWRSVVLNGLARARLRIDTHSGDADDVAHALALLFIHDEELVWAFVLGEGALGFVRLFDSVVLDIAFFVEIGWSFFNRIDFLLVDALAVLGWIERLAFRASHSTLNIDEALACVEIVCEAFLASLVGLDDVVLHAKVAFNDLWLGFFRLTFIQRINLRLIDALAAVPWVQALAFAAPEGALDLGEAFASVLVPDAGLALLRHGAHLLAMAVTRIVLLGFDGFGLGLATCLSKLVKRNECQCYEFFHRSFKSKNIIRMKNSPII